LDFGFPFNQNQEEIEVSLVAFNFIIWSDFRSANIELLPSLRASTKCYHLLFPGSAVRG